MAGVSLIKAIIGTSLPAKPTNHLLPAPGPLLGRACYKGKAHPRGMPAHAEMPGWQLFLEALCLPNGGQEVQQERAFLPRRAVSKVTQRNSFRSNPDWSQVFNHTSLSQEMEPGKLSHFQKLVSGS